MKAQAKVSRRRLKRKLGSTQRVLIDEVGATVAVGRSSADAPEVDGKVYVHGAGRLKPGQFVEVEIERVEQHDLHGRAVARA
jgi:ribosomal protein S12 methylthiotransferase